MKTALVTGSAKRLGREIALGLIADGWQVIVNYHNSHPDLELQHQAKVVVQADLADIKQHEKLFQHGKIDLLVNSASVYEKKKFMESSEADFDANMDVHVKAPYFLSQRFAAQGGSHIINIVDAFTVNDKSIYFPYLLSKKALRDLSRMLAVALAPDVRVNSIMPGAMREYSDNLDADFKARRKALIPQGDFASSKDVIKAIKFLNESSFTGQEIFVDAGEHLI